MSVETTSMQAHGIVVYVFRSHGRKSINDLRSDPSAAAQLRARDALQTWLSSRSDGRTITTPLMLEYRRSVDGLASLPKLKACLEAQAKIGGRVFIDDFRRLFARCRNGHRGALFEELRDFGNVFLDLRFGCALPDLTRVQITELLSSTSPIRTPFIVRRGSGLSEDERRDQTRAATEASSGARQDAATRAANEIRAIKANLIGNGTVPTLKAIADAANHRGLRTTRGTPWSESTVCRALRRLDNRAVPTSDRPDLEGAQET